MWIFSKIYFIFNKIIFIKSYYIIICYVYDRIFIKIYESLIDM